MRDQLFSTRLTELLGIRHPILCGGMMWLGDARYAAACVNAGAMGFISALTCGTPQRLREEVALCRELTGGKPFGVNLYVSARPELQKKLVPLVDVVCEEGVQVVETAGGPPTAMLPRLREAGVKVIHKVPAVRFAKSAERAGVDAIIVVGAECGGHPGYMMIGSMVHAAQAPREISVPVVIGGGIGTGAQLAGVLAMGGEGVLLGTRMLVAEEIWAHRDYKQRIVDGDGTDSAVVMQIFRNHHRILNNEAARAVSALEAEGVDDFERYRALVAGETARRAYETGDTRGGMLDYGQGACFADAIEPVEGIIDRLVDGAEAAVLRLQSARAGTCRDTCPDRAQNAC